MLLVLVNQIGTLVVSRLATGVNATSDGDAGIAVYQMAFAIFMLPQSVITVSLVTARVATPGATGGGRTTSTSCGSGSVGPLRTSGCVDRARVGGLHRAGRPDRGAALPLRRRWTWSRPASWG